MLAALIGACGDDTPRPSAPPLGKVLAAWLASAEQARAPWRCAALDSPALPDEELAIGNRRWKISGQTLQRIDPDDVLAIGVVADAAGSASRTIAALARLRTELEKSGPDLVITLGGMGATQAEIEATLTTLAERASWPIVALPGDLESATAHAAATAALRKRGMAVLDGRLVRFIEQPGAVVATLPGAGARERLVAGDDGCQWRAGDIAKLYTELAAKPGVRIVASSEAPRTSVGGEPAGELLLVPPTPIDVALHGPVTPAGSPPKTGGRDGAKIALSPGTADASRRLPDAHPPTAGLLVIRGGTWSWRTVVAK